MNHLINALSANRQRPWVVVVAWVCYTASRVAQAAWIADAWWRGQWYPVLVTLVYTGVATSVTYSRFSESERFFCKALYIIIAAATALVAAYLVGGQTGMLSVAGSVFAATVNPAPMCIPVVIPYGIPAGKIPRRSAFMCLSDMLAFLCLAVPPQDDVFVPTGATVLSWTTALVVWLATRSRKTDAGTESGGPWAYRAMSSPLDKTAVQVDPRWYFHPLVASAIMWYCALDMFMVAADRDDIYTPWGLFGFWAVSGSIVLFLALDSITLSKYIIVTRAYSIAACICSVAITASAVFGSPAAYKWTQAAVTGVTLIPVSVYSMLYCLQAPVCADLCSVGSCRTAMLRWSASMSTGMYIGSAAAVIIRNNGNLDGHVILMFVCIAVCVPMRQLHDVGLFELCTPPRRISVGSKPTFQI